MIRSSRTTGDHLIHMRSLGGHRREYLALFSNLFALEASTGRVGWRNVVLLVRARRLLFGTLDDDYGGFLLVGLLRALLGRRTVGVLLRPQTCFQNSELRYTVKKALLAAIKKVPGLSIFTIVPFSVAPEYALVATDGLVDPQLWDMENSSCEEASAKLEAQIETGAQGRRVIAFVGTASPIKGIEYLVDLMSTPDWPEEDIFVVAAGHFPKEMLEVAQALKNRGALVLPHFISHAELLAVYAQADLIWACYRSDYDQASGIFGRAVQLSKIPVVRRGSLIAKFARHYDLRALELDYSSPPSSLKAIFEEIPVRRAESAAKTAGWKQDFIAKVEGSL